MPNTFAEKIHYLVHAHAPRVRCGKASDEVIGSMKLDRLTCKQCLRALGITILPPDIKRAEKVHFRHRSTNYLTTCGINSGEFETTRDMQEVTCKSCLGRMRPNMEALEAK